jgi:hypothetical protein
MALLEHFHKMREDDIIEVNLTVTSLRKLRLNPEEANEDSTLTNNDKFVSHEATTMSE